jgi:threonine dehydrogenase-like Zn-dependent dehydrogenase
LELARSLVADHVLYADEEDPVQRTREITGGRGADLVIEVAAVDPKPITDAVDLVRAGGTIVLAGAKGGKPIPGFVSDKMVLNSITMKGVFTVDSASYADAIRLIEADPEPFARLHDASFGLEQASRDWRGPTAPRPHCTSRSEGERHEAHRCHRWARGDRPVVDPAPAGGGHRGVHHRRP